MDLLVIPLHSYSTTMVFILFVAFLWTFWGGENPASLVNCWKRFPVTLTNRKAPGIVPTNEDLLRLFWGNVSALTSGAIYTFLPPNFWGEPLIYCS